MRQRGPPDPGHHAQERQSQAVRHVLGHLDRVIDVLEQAHQADPQAEAREQAQGDQHRPVGLDRHGRLGHARPGTRTQSLLTSACFTILNSVSRSRIRAICLAFSSRSLRQRQHLLVFGHRVPHLGQQLVVLFPVGFELAAVLFQDHLGRARRGRLGLDRASVLRFRRGCRRVPWPISMAA